MTFDFWLSTSNSHSYTFLSEFYQDYVLLQNEIQFTPWYASWPISRYPLFNFNDDTNPHCISGGRYCAQDPDGSGPLTGRDVLKEDLKQICIWKNYNNKWWQYVLDYAQSPLCVTNLSSICINQIIQKNDIDSEVIDNCYNSSFETDNYYLSDNTLYKEQTNQMEISGVRLFPTAVINQMIYRVIELF